MTRLGRLIPIALAVMAVAAPSANAAPGATFGFNGPGLGLGHSDATVTGLLQRTGVSVVRYGLDWRAVEPQPGERRWGGFDKTYDIFKAAGIDVLPVLRSVPAWAQVGSCSLFQELDCQRPPAPEYLDDWRRFVHDVAVRYPDLAGIEVFNEQNYADYNWQPRADPVYYTRVLRDAHQAVKSARPDMPVVLGGLSNRGQADSPESMTDERFLAEMYRAGAKGAMDAISIHPYSHPHDPRAPDSRYRQTLNELRSVRDGAGDAGTPFWITEVGYHTGLPALGGVSQELQAEYLVALLRLALDEYDVDMVLLHTFIDRDESGFGVLRSDLSPKPALAALEAIVPPALTRVELPGLFRATLEVRYRLSKAGTVALAFKPRRGRRQVARWSAQPGANVHVLTRRIGRRRLPRGSYRVTMHVVDAHGNRSQVFRGSVRVPGGRRKVRR